MRILVLGGMGFLGKALIKRLTESDNHEITVFDRTIPGTKDSRIQCMQGSFESGYDFDSLVKGTNLVFHLISTSIPGNEKKVLEEVHDNVIPSIELFNACARQGVHRIVFMSSGGTVYGASTRPNKETDLLSPINTYGLQKAMIEQALQYVSHDTGLEYQIVRLSNPYGPGQNPLGTLGLITKLVYQALHHETINIFGDGSVVRDFIYIDDAIQAILDIVYSGESNAIYNVGRGMGVSVSDVVAAISSTLPEKIHIEQKPGRKVDVPYSVLDIEKYKHISSIDKFISLDQGIMQTYQYFKEHSR